MFEVHSKRLPGCIFPALLFALTAIFGTGQTNTAANAMDGQVFIVQQDLKELIREASRRQGFEANISRKVRGNVTGEELPLDIEEILKSLAADHDLKWYFQQNQLFVSTGNEISTRLIYLGAMTFPELETAMETAQIKGEQFDLAYVEESNSVLVNGPVSFIASIELLAEAYNKNAKNRRSNVRVIRFGRIGN